MDNNFDTTHDEFTDTYKVIPKKHSGVYCYLTLHDKNLITHLVVHYSDKNWIFFNKVTFLIDGVPYSYDAGITLKNVDQYNSVNEVSDVIADTILIKKVAFSKSTVKIRLLGRDYYRDYTLSTDDIGSDDYKSFKDVIQLRNLIGPGIHKQ